MKKEYNAPKAEKLDFNYQETIVASGAGSLKEGSNINGCYDGANANPDKHCTPVYS